MTTTPLPLDVKTSTAVLSPCGRYRYELLRRWDASLPLLDARMLNPSKADAERNDPTIRRVIDFARRWGFGGIRVTNQFALRATDPAELLVADDPIGPENLEYLRRPAVKTLVAWGAHAAVRLRAPAGSWPLPENAVCLGVTAAGAPRHPLYVRADTEPIPWQP
ncbi:hypothetical protein SEA_CAMBIARE_1 [Mycobacterium phage Cambiare]|uniref:Uncharacterized protein n=1 Tax=Mycobacterium phage Cambiare TaxID=1647305 RepID=A0A0F6WE62_9CAUD|nr:hypothetical protein AVT48_gp01 [Mycobacterium phage Cambiare]AKF14503.1 hypothetical protein SEA_CAMBIARE_1 [Mycobacterium phage Cambiare]